FGDSFRSVCGVLFVAADHVHLQHRNGAAQLENGVTGIVAASEKSFLLTGPSTQKDATGEFCPVAEGFSDFQKSRSPRTVIVCTVPDLAIRLTIVIVVSTNDHDLVSNSRILTLNDAADILRSKRLAKDIGGHGGLGARLRTLEVRQKL